MNLRRSVLSSAIAFATAAIAAPGLALAQDSAPRHSGDSQAVAADAVTTPSTIEGLVGVAFGLRADVVAARAVATSPDLAAKRAEVVAAATEVDRAMWAYLPKLTGTARYTRLSEVEQAAASGNIVFSQNEGPIGADNPAQGVALALGDNPLNQYTFSVGLTVPISDYFLRLSQGHDAAKHDQRAAALDEEASRARASADARLTYYAWARARLQRSVSEESLAQSKQHLADVLAAEEAGSSSRADVMRVKSQLAQSELLVRRSQNLEDATLDLLRTVMHEKGNASFQIGEDLREGANALGGPRVQAGARQIDALLADAMERRPEVRALEASADGLRRRGDAVRASYLPRLDAIGDLTYANPNQRQFPQTAEFTGTWSAGVQLSWTFSDIPGALAQKDGFDAKVQKLEADRAALADAIRKDIASAVQSLRDATAAVETYAVGLASAEESYRTRRELFKVGRATSAELTDAETDLTRARLDAVGSQVDVRTARVKLSYAIGNGGS